MDIQALTPSATSRLKPWSFEHTAMHPKMLLICKLFVLLLFTHNFWGKLVDPFLPFIPEMDEFRAYPGGFKAFIRSAYLIATLGLVLNVKVRTAALVLGCTILLQQISSKAEYRNHLVVIGCVLILAGLSDRDKDPVLIIWQLSLIYFGAFINKILDPAWWDGSFTDNWLRNEEGVYWYLWVTNYLPGAWLPVFLSWAGMLSELLFGLFILFKKYRPLVFVMIFFFHSFLFLISMQRFGHFYENLLIILILSIDWRAWPFQVAYKKGVPQAFRQFFGLFDWEKKARWTLKSDSSLDTWMDLKTAEGIPYHNHDAVRVLLLATPAFYIGLLGFNALIVYFLEYQPNLNHALSGLIFFTCVGYFFPFMKAKVVPYLAWMSKVPRRVKELSPWWA